MKKLLLLLGLLCLPSFAQIARNNKLDLGTTTGTSLTTSYTVGSGANRILFVGVSGNTCCGGDLITGVTDVTSSAAFTLIGRQPAGASRYTSFWYLLDPPSGANTITVSASASSFISAGGADYSGAKQSGQPDASNPSTNPAANSETVSLTTVANNSWIILFGGAYSGGPCPTAGTGDTLLTCDATYGIWGIFDSNGPVSPGSNSFTINQSGASLPYNNVMASFAPATASAPHIRHQVTNN